AGWSIARDAADAFPAEGTSLERYAARFRGAEINSSFHRSHRQSTWERWAQSVPESFRFSVKLPKTITHQKKLADCQDLLSAYLDESSILGDKLTIHLVQLPPSLAFDSGTAESFFESLRTASPARIVCEPRHATWFEEEADALLDRCRIARVAADPARVPEAAVPGGWRGLGYFRLHGSPVPYRSSYEDERLDAYAGQIRAASASGPVWCMFDNTASSAATANALSLIEKLGTP
ncbi:MAG TPA: DUF72 domain-containing protein, partial [Allosphingosinicella sp.]|nr:DUF72 domain-containing protein [Allosphingosinicella sp.]